MRVPVPRPPDLRIICRKRSKLLIEMMESDKPNFAKQYFVDKAIDEVAFILERIDKKWPTS